MNETPFWKRIYQTISGCSSNIVESDAFHTLQESKTDLLNGLLVYKAYTKKSFDTFSETTDIDEDLKGFILALSQDLNLESAIAYTVLCNYLMYEYHGKVKEFRQITRRGTTPQLRDKVWIFYTAERMFFIKCWRHIFEFSERDHLFSEQYKKFLRTVTMSDLHNNLIQQFHILSNELSFESFYSRVVRKDNLLCRNIRERIEIVSVLVLAIRRQALNIDCIPRLLDLFIKGNFGTVAPVYDLRQLVKRQDLTELMYIEIGCFLEMFEYYWDKELNHFWANTSIVEMDKMILNLHSNPAQTFIKFCWSLFRHKYSNLRQNIERVLHLLGKEPFVLLNSLVADEMFKDCQVGQIVLKATHRLLDELCLSLPDRIVIYEQKDSIKLVSHFFKNSELADLCFSDRNGVDELVKTAADTFPLDFMSFTLICQKLVEQKLHYKSTIHLLNNMPLFLSDIEGAGHGKTTLGERQLAFPTSSGLIEFPPETVLRPYRIFGTCYRQYTNTKYSYFLYLEYLVNLLITGFLDDRKLSFELIQKIKAGYEIVISAIKNCTDMDLEKIGLQRIILKLNRIIVHLEEPFLDHNLIQLYFRVLHTLQIYRNVTLFQICPEKVKQSFFPKIKGYLLEHDIDKLLLGPYIFEDKIFMKFFDAEEYRDDHRLILAYIDLLRGLLKVEVPYRDFQISGIAFLINFVFLRHQNWPYENMAQRTLITRKCLSIFHNILQKESSSSDKYDPRLYYLCQHAFLNNDYVIDVFFRLFVKEKNFILFTMERQSQWDKYLDLDSITCIRLQLSLLLIIINQKQSYGQCAIDEHLSYIIKPIASYFTNSYSPKIAELTCRCFEKFAQDQNIPLLALLELDHNQVQSLFLEKLKDPLEDDNLKIAIVDFINACIATQNGLTAAFFNLKCFKYWDETDRSEFGGDSVSEFMVPYLNNIGKVHESTPLQLSMLRLLYNLWVNHRDSLIHTVPNIMELWPVVALPFHGDYKGNVEVYLITLLIIVSDIEIYKKNLDKNLVNFIEDFFKSKEQLRKWNRFILTSTTNDLHKGLDILSTWIQFLIICKKYYPGWFEEDTRIILLNSCLDGLNYTDGPYYTYAVLTLWAQLYFVLISDWRVSENQKKSLLFKYNIFLSSLKIYYKHLEPKTKEIILFGLNCTINDLQDYFVENREGFSDLLDSFGEIAVFEYEYLQNVYRKVENFTTYQKMLHLKPWLIILSITNSLISLPGLRDIAMWFHYRNFLQRFMNTIELIIHCPASLPFAKAIIVFFMEYLQSPLFADFLELDFQSFYKKIRPPVLTITFDDISKNGVPIHVLEWWVFYMVLIKFNKNLLEKLELGAVKLCTDFISQNDYLLKDFLSMIKWTVDITALNLSLETLQLVDLFYKYKPYWQVEISLSYNLIMDGVKTALNACGFSVLGYKKIHFYEISLEKQLNLVSNPPADLLSSVLNKITEIFFWASTCLRKAKPDLITKYGIVDILYEYTFFIESDFSIPRFDLDISSQVTYGTLLSIADFLCRTLNQLSATAKSNQLASCSTKPPNTLQRHEDYMGFMFHFQADEMIHNKLRAFTPYDMTEFSVTFPSSIISQLNFNTVRNALEALMLFISYEIFYTSTCFSPEKLFLFKKELNSELQFFYEFVRKRSNEQYNLMDRTPRRRLITETDTEILRRYAMKVFSDGQTCDIADNSFYVIIAQFLYKFCHLYS